VGRLLLLLLLVVLLLWLVRRALGARTGRPTRQGAAAPAGELVSCAHCGLNLPRGEARQAGGRHYCCEEHGRLGPRAG